MNEFWSALVGAGGASVIILGLSAWLGRVWAARILAEEKAKYAENLENDRHNYAKVLENEKHKYSLALEEAKKDYEIHVEGVKAILLRYSQKQFDIYGELWVSLCHLKKSMDELWAGVSSKKVKEFSSQLNEAKFYLEKSSLFIDDEHLSTIHQALYQLDEFVHGKGELMQVATARGEGSNQERRDIVDGNRYRKEEYDNMLRSLRSYFKSKISGT